jgi:hypothetical protein
VTLRLAGVAFGLGILGAPGAAFGADATPAPPPQEEVQEQDTDRPGFIKRTVDKFLSDDEPHGGIGPHLGPLVPRFEVVSPGAGPAPMLHFWAPDIGRSGFDVHASASYSIYDYMYLDAQVGWVPHDGLRLQRMPRGTNGLFTLGDLERTAPIRGFQIYASGRYRDYPREDYYGIGIDAPRVDRSDYRLKDGTYEGVVRYGAGPISFMGRAGVLETSIFAGEDPDLPDTTLANDELTAPGLRTEPDFNFASAGLWLELRDQPGNAHRGVSLGVAVSRFDDRGGRAYQWTRMAVDAREYIPLGSPRHVLAFRQVTSLDSPDSGTAVPFYMQGTLGGSLFLPGYGSFRFRDNKMALFLAEYRFELKPKVELALMYDGGTVFPTFGSFDVDDVRRSYGIGIRLKSPQKVKIRLDAWHSKEGNRFRLKFGPSF